MKIVLIAALLLTALGAGPASAQLQLPWSAQTGGGGTSAGGGWVLTSSIGQPAPGTVTGTNFILEGGFIPGVRSLSGATSLAEVTVGNAWNLLSVPVITADPRKSVLFPASISNAFAYYPPPIGYAAEETLETGVAYWLKFPAIETVPISGTTTALETVQVAAGWNMIGTISYPVIVSEITADTKILITSAAFGFAGGLGYYAEDTLKPGLGYWVKVDGPGGLVLRAASSLAAPSAPVAARTAKKPPTASPEEIAAKEGYSVLTVRDNAGRERRLYFASEEGGESLNRFELPPPPPAGVLDVRYGSDRSLALAGAQSSGRQEFPIAVAGAEYPISVSWSAKERGSYALEFLAGAGKKPGRIALEGSGSRSFTRTEAAALALVAQGGAPVEVPKEFALYQNFPNPFNPATEIRFDLPAPSRVSLVVFNLLGEQVAVLLADAEHEAGRHTVRFGAEKLPSGLYFYRLQAGDNVQTKKMTLVK